MSTPTSLVLVGDCRDVLPTLEAGSVHCVVTSPPYWSLRDYGIAAWEGGSETCDHVAGRARNDTTPEALTRRAAAYRTGTGAGSQVDDIQYRDTCGKCGARRIDKQLGLEAQLDCLGAFTGNPCGACWICHMVEVMRGVWRVLRDDGTCWVNVGSSYACSPNGRSAAATKALGRDDRTFRDKPRVSYGVGIKPKDDTLQPARLALALQADGWYVRSQIIWHKPAPMPESVRDRPTSAHETVWLLSKRERYYYDADAVREGQTGNAHSRGNGLHPKTAGEDTNIRAKRSWEESTLQVNIGGRNLRNVWTLSPEPFPDAHFATYPTSLVRPCILAGTSAVGCCPVCGAGWRRVVERTDTPDVSAKGSRFDEGKTGTNGNGRVQPGERYVKQATGWQPGCDCPHTQEDCVPATVLDPFAGSGTTGLVAAQYGRSFIGVELSEAYAQMARQRIAPALAQPCLEVTP